MWKDKRLDTNRIALSLGLVSVLTGVSVLLLPQGAARQIPVFLLLWIWPAIAWSLMVEGSLLDRLLIGAGLALLLNALCGLVYSFFPGAILSQALLLSALLVSLIPLIMALKKPDRQLDWSIPTKSMGIVLLLLFAIALFLRLTNMGYKELQGDEGVILVRAADVLLGNTGELLNHQKGPIEILLPAITWGLTGLIDDFWARLPFTWAGILGVAAIYFLARKWFGEISGIAAFLLYALGGFGIAFSRIIQYQSLVVLWCMLALLSATRFRAKNRRVDLWLTAVFIAGGLLAHYDAILFVPAVLWILYTSIKERPDTGTKHWIFAGFLGLTILALFYLPFVLSPSFGATLSYLLGDRVGASNASSVASWSGARVWQMATFYNSIWYIIGLGTLVILGLWQLIKRRDGAAAIILLSVPTVFYIFIVEDPRTHIYTLFPGAVIIGGLGAAYVIDLVHQKESRTITLITIAATSLWIAVVFIYPFLMFVDTSVERQRTWTENRPLPWLFPTTWTDPPEYGLFGFPHQAGWRLIPELMADKDLPYGSNEEEEITNWYMAQAPRTHCANFQSFLVAANTQDSIPYDPSWLNSTYVRTIVSVDDRETVEIHTLEKVANVDQKEAVSTRLWRSPLDITTPETAGEYSVDITLDDNIRLIGYDLDLTQATPGGTVLVTLFWEALKPIGQNKQVFVHLSDGELLAQHDGAPECDLKPTSGWVKGQLVNDPHIVELPDDIPTGSYSLSVGMYDLITKDRLSVPGSTDDAIHLTELTIHEE